MRDRPAFADSRVNKDGVPSGENMISKGKRVVCLFALVGVQALQAQTDPGPRTDSPGAGGPIPGLSLKQGMFFNDGQTRFSEVESLAKGLGPRFNLTSCAGCHAHPALGGSSPASNPQVTGNVAPAAQVAALTSLGVAIAARMRSMQGFQMLMNFLVMPMYFLSGAMFPTATAPAWMRPLMLVDPLTYGVAALRGVVWSEVGVGPGPTELSLAQNVGILGLSALVLATIAALRFNRAD